MDRFEKQDREARQRAIAAHEERLTKALVKVSVSLIAAISYIKATPETKRAAMSDKAFDATLVGFERSLEMGREAVSGYSIYVPEPGQSATELKKLAAGCRIKADLYAKAHPEIPASFHWIADEIERLSAAPQHREG